MGEKQNAFEEDMANLNTAMVDAVDKQNEMAEDIDGIKEKIGGFESLLWGKNVCVPRGQ